MPHAQRNESNYHITQCPTPQGDIQASEYSASNPHSPAKTANPIASALSLSLHFRFAESYFLGRMANNSCPYSIGWPLETSFSTTSPATSDSISFMSFIASTVSTMQSTSPD